MYKIFLKRHILCKHGERNKIYTFLNLVVRKGTVRIIKLHHLLQHPESTYYSHQWVKYNIWVMYVRVHSTNLDN